MQAIEFETYSKDRVIEIPEKFKGFNNTKIKVIIMKEEGNDKEQNLKDFLEFAQNNRSKLPNDYKFDRDETHER